MIETVIADLPPAPTRANTPPDLFPAMADALAVALQPLVDQINDVGGEMNALAVLMNALAMTAVNAPGTQITSAGTATLGQGAKSFPTQTGKAVIPGMWLTATANGGANAWMTGFITAYNSATGALTLNVMYFNGTPGAEFTGWTLALSPPVDFVPATKEQIWAGTATSVGITPLVMAQALAPQPLTFATPLVINGANFLSATVAVTGNFIMPAPQNLLPGQTYLIDLIIGGAGNFTWAPDANAYKPISGQMPALSLTAGARDTAVLRALTATTADLTLIKGR